jgi:dephospho-CoA kinase
LSYVGTLARLARIVVREPGLLVPLLRTGWRFRRRSWYRRAPFLPLPPPEYLDWRLYTAYGDEQATPPARELGRYLRWVRWMTAGPAADHRADSGAVNAERAWRDMFRVGLTGNVASGKSSVASVWRDLGAFVIDADELARRAVVPGSPVLAAIGREFGPDVLAPDGSLDRAAMRRRMLEDAAVRRRLEALVHPEVGRLRLQEERRAAEAGVDIVVHDIPLLFEVGLDRQFDLVVLVDSPEPLRLDRLVAQRGMEREQAAKLIAAQMPASAKRTRSDLVIENAGTLDELAERAKAAWNEIRQRSRRS